MAKKTPHHPPLIVAGILVITAAAFITLVKNPSLAPLAQTDSLIQEGDLVAELKEQQDEKIRRAETAIERIRRLWAQNQDIQQNRNIWPVLREVAPVVQVSCESDAPVSDSAENPTYVGEVVKNHVETFVNPGDEFMLTLYVKNTGTAPWFGDKSGCTRQPYTRLGTSRDQDRKSPLYEGSEYLTTTTDSNWVKANRIRMWEPRVNPGEIATFSFTSKAPVTHDVFREYFSPVVEGTAWLDRPEELFEVDVYVGGDDDGRDEERLRYLNKSSRASVINLDGVREIEVDISDQTMKLKVDDFVAMEFFVSTGTFQTPTPISRGKIANKQELRISNAWPHYHMPNWLGIAYDKNGGRFVGYGIHSLPYLANDKGIFWSEAYNHIGRRVSHGCIRVLPDDSDRLFSLVEVGDLIWVHE